MFSRWCSLWLNQWDFNLLKRQLWCNSLLHLKPLNNNSSSISSISPRLLKKKRNKECHRQEDPNLQCRQWAWQLLILTSSCKVLIWCLPSLVFHLEPQVPEMEWAWVWEWEWEWWPKNNSQLRPCNNPPLQSLQLWCKVELTRGKEM